MPKPIILCVDDEKLILDSLKEQLRRLLDNQYLVELAENGQDALELIKELLADGHQLGVVISDQIMPGMKGNEFLKAVHGISPDTLKILLTGQADADAVGQAVNQAKLYRYIPKPWDPTDLIMTVKEAMRSFLQDKKLAEQNHALMQANDQLAQLNATLEAKVEQRTAELSQAYHRLKQLHTRMQEELQIGHDIQQGLLLPVNPNWSQLDVFCFNAPAQELGGDFYVYHVSATPANHEDGATLTKYTVAIGDVSGKGVSAALLMAASLAQFDASMMRQLGLVERVVYLDEAIKPYTQSRNYNCAICCVELVCSHREGKKISTLEVVNAGCISPYIKRADQSVEWLDVSGFALGVELAAVMGYNPLTVSLSAGDMVILTSDGLVEAMNADKEMFGFERLETVIAAAPMTSSEALLLYIKEAVFDFMGPAKQQDDITIVVLQL